MEKREIKIAELSNAIIAYQITENISNIDMLMIIQEIAQMWARKLFMEIKGD